MNNEAALAAALLYLALEDAVTDTVTRETTHRVRDTAYTFCTARTGEWARSREAWCLLADVDPDAFREAAERRIAATRAALANGTATRIAGRRMLASGVGA